MNADLREAGATGGGYVLSRGVLTRASLFPGKPDEVEIIVDGDASYRASTTARAIGLLLENCPPKRGLLRVEQSMQVPVGGGFGASAAAAVSGVYAVAAVLGKSESKSSLAACAHRAEIIEGTGLGTVSAIFDGKGAGAIYKPGAPGVAEFLNVDVPRDLRIVTAFVAPYDKREALSSKKTIKRINRLGEASLRRFLAGPTIDSLAEEGERFAKGLGLESAEVVKLVSAAKEAGASYASQNMIGYAVHALVDKDRGERVAARLSDFGTRVRVDTFRPGSRKAGVFG
jgi:pantoate kinase